LHVIKRKRGRPKGSTKKPISEEETSESGSVAPVENKLHVEGAQVLSEPEPEILECRKCNRTFSNVRQLKKHICIIVLNEDEEVTQGNDFEGKFILSDCEKEKEKQPKKSRIQKTDKTSQSKEQEKTQGAVNPIVRVLLTAHEAIADVLLLQLTKLYTTNPSTPNCTLSETRGKIRKLYQHHYSMQLFGAV
ncbi:Zinc finger ZFAT, partial, partial [Pelobates cultripes]